MIMRLALLLLFCLATPALAAAPADYAFAWPLDVSGLPSSAWQFELPPAVHAVLVTDDQRDFQIFDADGKPLPLARYEPPPPLREEKRIPLPVFAIPRRPDGGDIDARLRVVRAPDGSLRQIEADLANARTGPQVADYLLDASRVEEGIDALQLAWSAGPGAVRGRFAVEESDDLERWRTVVQAATVVDLQEGAATLARRRIALGGRRARYLRLRTLDDVQLGTLSVEAVIELPLPAPALRWIEAELTELNDAGVTTWRVPGSFDVVAARVLPRGERALTEVVLRSRHDGTWIERTRLTLFSLRQGEERVERDRAAISEGPRARRWQLVASPPLDVPPRLLLGVRPDRFAFLLQGRAPFILAAGSGDARRPPAPVGDALEEIGRRMEPRWQPPIATLGDRFVLSGEQALAPTKEIPWPQVLLWSALVAGVLLVAALALRMLHVRPGQDEA
jgi:hypothetical protein